MNDTHSLSFETTGEQSYQIVKRILNLLAVPEGDVRRVSIELEADTPISVNPIDAMATADVDEPEAELEDELEDELDDEDEDEDETEDFDGAECPDCGRSFPSEASMYGHLGQSDCSLDPDDDEDEDEDVVDRLEDELEADAGVVEAAAEDLAEAEAETELDVEELSLGTWAHKLALVFANNPDQWLNSGDLTDVLEGTEWETSQNQISAYLSPLYAKGYLKRRDRERGSLSSGYEYRIKNDEVATAVKAQETLAIAEGSLEGGYEDLVGLPEWAAACRTGRAGKTVFPGDEITPAAPTDTVDADELGTLNVGTIAYRVAATFAHSQGYMQGADIAARLEGTEWELTPDHAGTAIRSLRERGYLSYKDAERQGYAYQLTHEGREHVLDLERTHKDDPEVLTFEQAKNGETSYPDEDVDAEHAEDDAEADADATGLEALGLNQVDGNDDVDLDTDHEADAEDDTDDLDDVEDETEDEAEDPPVGTGATAD